MGEPILRGYARLRRGLVWCKQCGTTLRVNPALCLVHGWPVCHGETMTIDSPDERAESAREQEVTE